MVDDVRDRDERLGPSTYLTDNEAKEFHKLFVISFIAFTAIALVAHFLVWNWHPWGLKTTTNSPAGVSAPAAAR